MRSRLISVGLGLVLLVTALMKASSPGASAATEDIAFLTNDVRTLGTVWDIFLGVWLLIGVARGVSWVLAILTFGAFALLSGWLGWQGVADCGCFGSVPASPWWAFAVDCIALVLLILHRPARIVDPAPALQDWQWTLMATGSVFMTAVLVGAVRYGSPYLGLARLRGDVLLLQGDSVNFGTGQPGEHLTTSATIHNHSSQDVTLVGGTADCSCLTTHDLPLTIAAGGEASVRVQLLLPADTSGLVKRNAMLRTDHPHQRTLWLPIVSRVSHTE